MRILALQRDAVRLIRRRVNAGLLPEEDGEVLARAVMDPGSTSWNWDVLKDAHFGHLDGGEFSPEHSAYAEECRALVWLVGEILSLRRETEEPAKGA